MGEALTRKNDIEDRWRDYFGLLNSDEIREVGEGASSEKIGENENS